MRFKRPGALHHRQLRMTASDPERPVAFDGKIAPVREGRLTEFHFNNQECPDLPWSGSHLVSSQAPLSSTRGACRRRDQELLPGRVRAKEPLSEPNHMRALPWISRSAIHEFDETGMNLRPADLRIRKSSFAFVALLSAHLNFPPAVVALGECSRGDSAS
jgi:hypothetical protein